MTNWVRIDEDIAEHPKTQWLAEKTGLDIDACVGKLVRLFLKVGRYVPNGDLGSVSFRTIEAWANWQGEPGLFWAAFVEHFVNGNEITGWMARNGKIADYEERERARKAEWWRTHRAPPSAPTSALVPPLGARDRRASAHGTGTGTDTERTTLLNAREKISDLFLGSAQRLSFEKSCDAWLEGMNLAPGLKATADDIERACDEWLFQHPHEAPGKKAMRAFVESSIRERLKNAERPAPTPPGKLTRHNGKVSAGEQGYVNARRAMGLSDYPDDDEDTNAVE